MNTWDQFKELCTAKYTLYSTDVKHRRHFHAIRQESDDVEQYITEFAKRLSLVANPNEEEVLMVFFDGLDTKVQQHLYQEQVTTIADANRLTRAIYLARSHTIRDAPIPRQMHLEQTKGSHATPM